MSKKQYISATNESPRLSIGTIVLWFIAIDYFNWPEWVYGVWGILAILLVANFFYRILAEDRVNVVDRGKS